MLCLKDSFGSPAAHTAFFVLLGSNIADNCALMSAIDSSVVLPVFRSPYSSSSCCCSARCVRPCSASLSALAKIAFALPVNVPPAVPIPKPPIPPRKAF